MLPITVIRPEELFLTIFIIVIIFNVLTCFSKIRQKPSYSLWRKVSFSSKYIKMCYFSFVKIIYEQINFTEKDQMDIIFSICFTVCNRPGDVVTLPFGGSKYKKKLPQ